MLTPDELRRLAGIEQQLRTEDPDLAQRLSHARPLAWLLQWLSARRVLGLVAAVLAVLCLFLGEGAGFFTAGVLAGALFLLDGWSIQA